MKKILGFVVLSLFAISASAADLMASSTAPTVTQNIVVEGAACPGVGATGFSSTGLLLSCQSGMWQSPKASVTPIIRATFSNYTACAADEKIIGGSITCCSHGEVRYNYPSGNGWQGFCSGCQGTTYAICAK